MFFHEIETDRLLLKNISYDDREFILKQFSDDDVNRYLFDAEPLTSLEEADELIDFYVEPEPRGQHRWILTLKEDGTKIGTCGFHCWDTKDGYVEVGYDMQKAYWGQGYMSEAMKAILAFARQEMKVTQIDANIAVENQKSSNLVKRFGFEDHGETTICTFRGKDYLHNVYTLNC